MKRALVLIHRFQDVGGAIAVAAWALQALCSEFNVTLVAWEPFEPERVDATFGTTLAGATFTLEAMPAHVRKAIDRAPIGLSLLKMALLQRRARALLRAQHFDVVVSISNEIDVGTHAVQYVHFPWGYFPRPDTDLRWYHPAPLVRLYRWAVCGFGGISRRRIAANTTLVNSAWTGQHYVDWYGGAPQVLYPPVHTGGFEPEWSQRTDTFACVGRLSPEKRILEIIEILAEVRRRGRPVALMICGLRDNLDYEARVRAAVLLHGDWISLHLDQPREELLARIAACRFGIHGMIDEHFGIAVAELIRMGCVCFAPAEGGPAETLDGDERLLYASDEQAVEKICAVLADPALLASVRAGLSGAAERFGSDAFMQSFRDVCNAAIGRSGVPVPATIHDARRRTHRLRQWLKRALPAPLLMAAGRVYRALYPFYVRSLPVRTEDLETPTGCYRVPLDAPHDVIISAIRSGTVFEQGVVDVCCSFLRAGGAVIDVGANLGQMSVQFSRAVGPRGHVVAIEANPDIYALLAYNLAANGCANAEAIFGAAYRESGRVARFPIPRFWRYPNYGSYGITPGARRGHQVRTLTLDELELPYRVDVIKIDAQGSDLDVLRGARKLIARDAMPILFEYSPEFDAEFQTSFPQYEAFIAEIGYRITFRSSYNILIEAVSGVSAR